MNTDQFKDKHVDVLFLVGLSNVDSEFKLNLREFVEQRLAQLTLTCKTLRYVIQLVNDCSSSSTTTTTSSSNTFQTIWDVNAWIEQASLLACSVPASALTFDNIIEQINRLFETIDDEHDNNVMSSIGQHERRCNSKTRPFPIDTVNNTKHTTHKPNTFIFVVVFVQFFHVFCDFVD